MGKSWINDPYLAGELEERGQLYWQRNEPNRHEEYRTMPKVTEMFGGAFLKADDLQGKRVTVTITDVRQELLRGDHGEEEKWVVSFEGKEKRLVLNKTNANAIAATLGHDDTDEWIGQQIKLYPAMVDFQGRQVAAIRVYVDLPTDEAGADEIPF